jgi:predicted NAD-dependent protein-ADP-ribosyltransferase YbiA (DUF1768 family)
MNEYFHGSSVLFDKFDLNHALDGDGKCKFGYGVYVTPMYQTAVHYSACGKGRDAVAHYVYTVDVPSETDDNHIWSNKPVNPAIVQRAEKKLGENIPSEVCGVGKLFRKYIGNKLIGKQGTVKQLSSRADLDAEKAASTFLLSIGVKMLAWPYNQRNPDGAHNLAILDDALIKIQKVDKVEVMPQIAARSPKTSSICIRQYIEQYYPDYYSWNSYPVDQCIPIRSNNDEWGILGNFFNTPILVNNIPFRNSEQLFQMMKFSDKDILLDIYNANGMTIKMKSKKWQKARRARADWGMMIVDTMKFCLLQKYRQCQTFRDELERSRGKFIVEDETTRKSTSWGTQLINDHYEGSNLLGRLLMELRDNGKLEYHLPDDALDFLKQLI